MYNIFLFILFKHLLLIICEIKEEEKYIINNNDYSREKIINNFKNYYSNIDNEKIFHKSILGDKKIKNNFLEIRNLNTISERISNIITSDTFSNIFSDSTHIFSDSVSYIMKDHSNTKENVFSDIRSLQDEQKSSKPEVILSDYMNFIPTEKENENEVITNKVINEESPPKTLTNVIFLVQVVINNDNNLEIYIVSDALIPDYVLFIVTMNYYLQNNDNNDNNNSNNITVRTYFTFQKVEEDRKERLMCYTSNENSFRELVEKNKGKIIFEVINLQGDYVENSIISNYYYFVTYYLQNTGSNKKDIYNYTESSIKVRMYKIKTISSSTKECQFNLTLNNRFEGKNMKLLLEFRTNYTENKITRSINNKAECLFTYDSGKYVVCQLDPQIEGIELIYLCNGYIYNDEKEIYTVYLEAKNNTNFLVCTVDPPYITYIFICIYFILIIVVVIIVLIFLNKKGRGNPFIIK